MPVAPLVGAAAVTAAGSLAAGALGARSQNKATKAQSQSNAQALQFEREKEAYNRRVSEQRMAYQTALRGMLAQRYGIQLPDAGQFFGQDPIMAQAAAARGGPPMGRPPMAGGPPMGPGITPQGPPGMPPGGPQMGGPPPGGPQMGGPPGGGVMGRPYGRNIQDLLGY